MITVHEVSRLTGISIRTLQYYDKIGLLPPASYSESGYRLYDDTAMERLQQILLFRELEFPLKDIKHILDTPDFDRQKALEQQIILLELRKEHLENLILLARGIKLYGGHYMKFSAFDTKKLDEYASQVKKSWGSTAAYREFEEKSSGRSPETESKLAEGHMEIFAEMGKIRQQAPDCEAAQDLVKKLQTYISDHYYTCTNAILLSLGEMYAGGGEFTENIEVYGGIGTGEFAREAIRAYCKS